MKDIGRNERMEWKLRRYEEGMCKMKDIYI